MRRRRFGERGLEVTELCLGTMTFGAQADEAASFAILDAAYEGGIRFVDTADVYPAPPTLATVGDTEHLLGRWMRERGNRDDLVLATKGYFPTGSLPTERGNSRRHLTEACEASLRRLETDHVDVYLCHGWDVSVPIEQTLRALEDLKQAGKILHPGICNVRAHELAEAVVVAQRHDVVGFEGLQHRYSILLREAEESLFPVAAQFGLGVMVYNPLAGGLLTGKYPPGSAPAAGSRFGLGSYGEIYRARYWSEGNLEAAQTVARLCREHGISPVTASVAWALAHSAVSTVIVGASRPDQVAVNLDGAGADLPKELREELDAVWYAMPRTPPTLDTPRLAFGE
jgi:aryl-alcohol dehydrogenase-like predicted oxidoreductase